jgi:hypothetical protein
MNSFPQYLPWFCTSAEKPFPSMIHDDSTGLKDRRYQNSFQFRSSVVPDTAVVCPTLACRWNSCDMLWHQWKVHVFFMCFNVYFHDFPRFSMFYLSLSSPFQQAPKYTWLGACAPRVGSPTSSEIRQMNKNGNDQPILIPIKI